MISLHRANLNTFLESGDSVFSMGCLPLLVGFGLFVQIDILSPKHLPRVLGPARPWCRASQALNRIRFRAPLLQREEGKRRESRVK